MKAYLMAAALTFGLATPALADPPWQHGRGWQEARQDWREARRDDRREARREARRDWREDRRDWRNDRRDDRRDWRDNQREAWRNYRNYDWNRPDPRFGDYYADRYYRSGDYYPARTLGRNDRIYRGYDGRYYCRRSDGTTGLVIGAIGGGVLGNVIAPGGSKTLGSIIGGSLGAIIGKSLDDNKVKCR